jgi:hypothetical protein
MNTQNDELVNKTQAADAENESNKIASPPHQNCEKQNT